MQVQANNENRGLAIRDVVAHLAVLLWMIVVFCFTAQNGDESGDLSSGVTHLLMTIINQLFQLGWEEPKLLDMVALWDYPVRKLAHMTEFGILAVLIFCAIKTYKIAQVTKQRYLFAWLGAVAYAVTDEIHQLFVPGRSGNFIDVCVDASGALIAIALVYGVAALYRRTNRV